MPVVLNPSSEQAKELRRWEQHPTKLSMTDEGSFAPGNPYAYRPYPRMLYRAVKKDNGKVVCMPPSPSPNHFLTQPEYLRALAEAEQLQNECSRIVHDESQERQLVGSGWCDSPESAMAQFEKAEQTVAEEAARALYAAQRMGEKARQEFDAVNAEAGMEHIADVTPAVKRRVREQAQG